jgi:hypothetical protein
MTRLFTYSMILLAILMSPVWAQTRLTNDDIIKMTKSGLTEDFIINLIQQQPNQLSSGVSALSELKRNGVGENVIAAVVRKAPAPSEPLNSGSVVRLYKAGFSDDFLLDLIRRQPPKGSPDPGRIVELKNAGLSERLISALVATGGRREIPQGTEITIRTIDSIDSERAKEGDTFRASLEDPLEVDGNVIASKGADAMVRLAGEKESGKLTGRTVLTVSLESVNINGRQVPIRTSSVSQESKSRGARTAKSAAGVGAVGAIIGAIAGGGRGAAIGAGAGAAAGAGGQVFMKGQRVKIPSETVLTFTTDYPVKIE